MNAEELDIENIELELLLEGLWRRYGYDFRQYARAAIKRRIKLAAEVFSCPNFSELQAKLLHDPATFKRFVTNITVNVSEMFRDPPFFQRIRTVVVPILRTYPSLKIWVAGCSTGEEAYSLAILLHEAKLLERTVIHATDINEHVLESARAGIYRLDHIKSYAVNYQRYGGQESLAHYYTARYEHAILRPFLREHLAFSVHNLVTDHVFGEMNMILCRNVMIYFNNELKNRVLGLFFDSLCPNGFLCLGMKEALAPPYNEYFQEYDHGFRIYRKNATTRRSTTHVSF